LQFWSFQKFGSKFWSIDLIINNHHQLSTDYHSSPKLYYIFLLLLNPKYTEVSSREKKESGEGV
jgi:hypothetical protein